MNKIVIIGSPGAGKSTFAQQLGAILGIKVIHLDRYFFEPGLNWKEYPRQDRIRIEQRLIAGKDRWIIEGSYLSSSDYRLQMADTIIALDMPRLLCLWQAFCRRFWYQGLRPDLPENCNDRLRIFYILKILIFPHRGRKLLLSKIDEIKAQEARSTTKKTFHTFRSHKDADAYLQALSLAKEVQTHAQQPDSAFPHDSSLNTLASLFPKKVGDSALVESGRF
jgi:adenylate kinase family enzyme